VNKNLCLFVKSLEGDSLNGFVLGFGKNNTALYQKSSEMNLPDWPMVSMRVDEDDKQLKRLHEKELTFQSWDTSDLIYPYFACNPESEETKLLRQTYREKRGKIIGYFKGKNVVEATLSLFNVNLIH